MQLSPVKGRRHFILLGCFGKVYQVRVLISLMGYRFLLYEFD